MEVTGILLLALALGAYTLYFSSILWSLVQVKLVKKMVTADQQSSKEDQLKVHLQIYDVSHPGVSSFLGLLQPDIHTFLSRCWNAVTTSLYNGVVFHAPPIRSITIIIRPMDGIASTTSNILDRQHKEVSEK